ncbi:hypothetical protein GH789_01185 [Rhizobium pusense]|uniref:GT99 family glycosyltransferase N-terminal domain-containing protein n=1 Tax=Agrobacterium pusense TaxID=648995 RepID=UPI00129B7D29|nr:hypothetical protein [Agrobacterium pusense]MRG63902.1 hypothetical protein [Agrobacterium pusense]
MHFVLVIPPLSATGDETYYFWVFQKWLHETKEYKTSIITPPQYISALEDMSRWEFSERSFNFNQYLPSRSIGSHVEIVIQPQSLAEQTDNSPPTSTFVDLITREQTALTNFYVDALREIQTRVRDEIAVVTWLNNASLRSAAYELRCPLIFNELGPFRKPYYRQTAYWDRCGVNGETDVNNRWLFEKPDFMSWKTTAYPNGGALHALRALLAEPASHLVMREGEQRTKVGVALQVETDSNALAYGGGWTNLSLVNHVSRSDIAKESIVRLHPSGWAVYPGRIDLSPSPLEFLSNVEEIWTVNSSLGIEALFWGKKAQIFGDSPVKLITQMTGDESESFLEWFTLCYLVPFDLLFDLDYYVWRLANPSAQEIALRHLSAYETRSKHQWENIPLPPSADGEKLTVDFPSPQQLPAILAQQKLDLGKQQQKIEELESKVSQLESLIESQSALLEEREASLIDHQRALSAETAASQMAQEALATESRKLREELEAIKSSTPFRLLRRASLI